MLNQYLTDTALFLNDPDNLFYSQPTLTNYVNRARRWLSIQTMCIRALVTTVATVANQETYPISLANTAVAAVSGVAAPYSILAVAVQEGNYFPAMGRMDFPTFQTERRILNNTAQNYPDKFSTYNRGSTQVLYLSLVPAAVSAMIWDVGCTPINLATDADPEAIPLPWTDIVAFKAAEIAVRTQQRWTDADIMRDEVDRMMNEASVAELPFMVPEQYATAER